MTRFWIRIAIWSSLYELVRIFKSSHMSVFESAVYRVYNEYKFKSPVIGLGLLLPVRTAQTSPQCGNT